MSEKTIPAIMAPAPARDHPLTRSLAGMIGIGFLGAMLIACVLTLPWTTGRVAESGGGPGARRYDVQIKTARHLPPTWWGASSETGEDTQAARLEATARFLALRRIAEQHTHQAAASGQPPITVEQLAAEHVEPTPEQIADARPFYLLGTDLLGRDMLIRCLAGGGVSLGIGIAAAALSVLLGTLYGSISGYVGGRTDAVMMRMVDVLYGLPYILLVVLLAVAVDGLIDRWQASSARHAAKARAAMVEHELARVPVEQRELPEVRTEVERRAAQTIGAGEVSADGRQTINIVTLLVAIGGVSWLTMARVVRGQVLSLKNQPFMEAARAMGVPVRSQFLRHLLPNLVGPITVYATLTVPQAILQESFLSFLGIGVKPPLPSWGNLAADGLAELNPFKSNWWLLLFPCLLLGLTLLALNFVGEGLREALDPKRARR